MFADTVNITLKQFLVEPFRKRGRKRVFLLHDNSHPHLTLKTTDHFTPFVWNVLNHSALDLAPSDFFLFTPLKEYTVVGKHFSSNEKVKMR